MNIEQLLERIAVLEGDYIAEIMNLAETSGCTYAEAWVHLEEERKQYGLRPRIKNQRSVYNAIWLRKNVSLQG